ncbi:PGF-CTERM sorting domain-containing protein [Haloarchaeobius salinus]|uniref:PGF-CTERM sorting domain-containing protein n=1 Tax=Haloarchaeobius salinus TaxID=1198298 RepID=UPI00210D145A|nr:PGF-CTERM sorting domain-containing protein [Haloarchaeobius salinus]
MNELYTEELNGGATGDTALTDVTGSGLTINGAGELTVSGVSKWAEGDDTALLEPTSKDGVEVDTTTAISGQRVCRNFSRTLFGLSQGDTLEVEVTVNVNVTLATDATQAANYTVALYVDGVHVGNETVSLPAEGNRTISLSHRFAEPGEYAFAIDNQSVGSVTVESAGTTTTRTTADPSQTTEVTDGPTQTTGTTGVPAQTTRPTEGEATSAPASSPTEPATDGDVPGFGVLAAVLALLATAPLARRWY